MIDYLQQSQDAAKLAIRLSRLRELRDEAGNTVRATQLQIAALRQVATESTGIRVTARGRHTDSPRAPVSGRVS